MLNENIQLRRCTKITIDQGLLGYYIHNKIDNTNLGKMAAIVTVKAEKPSAELENFANKLAMHIVASKPRSLSVETIDKTVLEQERKILTDQAQQSGKPENIITKMVDGKLQKIL